MRRMLPRAIAGVVMLLSGVPGPAIAGGGCHQGVTAQDASGESEATVRMSDGCFEATVTTVDPGVPVTFVNDDAGITHNVGGNQWGHFDDMIEGDAFSVTFDDPGIYPFACNYHPGMTGAIVVGDGARAGGPSIVVEPFDAAPATTKDEGAPTFLLLGVGLGGLAIGLAAATVRRRAT